MTNTVGQSHGSNSAGPTNSNYIHGHLNGHLGQPHPQNFNRNTNHYSHNMHQFNSGLPGGFHNLTSQDVSKVIENSTKRRPSSYNDF